MADSIGGLIRSESEAVLELSKRSGRRARLPGQRDIADVLRTLHALETR